MPSQRPGKETVRVTVCRAGERLTFTVTQPQTIIEYDWIFRDNGRTVSGAYGRGRRSGRRLAEL